MPFSPVIHAFLDFLKGKELLLELTWNEYMEITSPLPETEYSVEEVTARYKRNGYNWDIHGTLYTPKEEYVHGNTILMVHGGLVNELTFDKAANGRRGWARFLSSQGFKVLSVSYPGLWPPEGVWLKPARERVPVFLFDREIELKELHDRILKYTFNLVVHGIATLVDQNLSGSDVLAFGHSIGGRLVVDLWRFTKRAKIVGVLGFGTLGPHVWVNELEEKIRQKRGKKKPEEKRPTLEELAYFRQLLPGVDEPRIMLPILRSIPELEECMNITGLPKKEYFNNSLIKEPDPGWLRSIKVLLLVGENDERYWPKDRPIEDRPQYFFAKKYAEITHGTHLVLIPKYTHTGHLDLHSEKMTCLWLWAIKSGYFK